MKHAEWLNSFLRSYEALGTNNLETLRDIYHQDVVFRDPMHQLDGLEALLTYFYSLYENLTSCQFVIDNVVEQEDQASVYWNMSYTHPKLNHGKPIRVEGHSHLRSKDGKVVFHRDYLDAGAMLYEHIPLLGSVVRLVKRRVAL